MKVKERYTSNEFKVFVETITPEIAKAILDECNTENRSIRKQEVKHYSIEMAHNEWVFDGTPIRFLFNGILADGQHRLSSIVNSEKAQECVIELGLSEEARLVIDTGSKRRTRDNLTMAGGFKFNNTILAGINYACGGYSKSFTLSAIETQLFIDKYINYIDIVSDYFTTVKKGLTKGAVVASALLALIESEKEEDVRAFLEVLIYGKYKDVTSGDVSVLRLRERLLSNTNSSGTVVRDDMKLIQRVFEAFKENTELSKLYIPTKFTYDIIEPESLYDDQNSNM